MKWRVVVALLCATICLSASARESAVEGRGVNVLAMGDWGENNDNERAVAREMGNYAKHLPNPLDAVLLAGDNFYMKLTGVDDPMWQKLFEDAYDRKALSVPFYSALGNHDYDGDNLRIELRYASEHPESRFKMPARWYRVDLPARNPLVTVLVLDSNQPNLKPDEWREQISWLEKQLAEPRQERWMFCMAHHPLFSNGIAADNGTLQKDWGSLFEKYNVDFYVCGHEHNLQQLEIPKWKTSFLLVGGGGAHPHPMLRDNRGPFSRMIFGFAHIEVTPDLTTAKFIDLDGKVVHAMERTKAGTVRVISTTGNDSPAANALNAILGRDQKATTRPSSRPTTRPATVPAAK